MIQRAPAKDPAHAFNLTEHEAAPPTGRIVAARSAGRLSGAGRLVALCANGPRQSAQLRPIVEEHGGTWEELPADTFHAAGTSVRTVLLTVQN